MDGKSPAPSWLVETLKILVDEASSAIINVMNIYKVLYNPLWGFIKHTFWLWRHKWKLMKCYWTHLHVSRKYIYVTWCNNRTCSFYIWRFPKMWVSQNHPNLVSKPWFWGSPSFRTPFFEDFLKSQNISCWYIVIEIDPFMKSLPILDLLIQEFYNVEPPNMMFVGL